MQLSERRYYPELEIRFDQGYCAGRGNHIWISDEASPFSPEAVGTALYLSEVQQDIPAAVAKAADVMQTPEGQRESLDKAMRKMVTLLSIIEKKKEEVTHAPYFSHDKLWGIAYGGFVRIFPTWGAPYVYCACRSIPETTLLTLLWKKAMAPALPGIGREHLGAMIPLALLAEAPEENIIASFRYAFPVSVPREDVENTIKAAKEIAGLVKSAE